MSLSNRAALLALSCALAWPKGARADAPVQAPPSLEQVEAARAPFRDARELHRQGRLNEAIAKMLDAYQVATTPVIALEAGRLLVEAGRLVTARELLRGVATLPVSPRESDSGRDARRDAAALAAQLDLRIPKIALTGRVAGLEVLLDGKPFAFAEGAGGQSVDPGGHALTLSVEGQVCASLAVPLEEGQSRTLDLRDAARACHFANAPSASAAAPPPRASPALEPPPASAPPSPLWPWGGVVLAGAGAIAAGSGMYVLFHAKSDYDAVSAGCSATGCDASAFDVRHRAHDQADVATVVAGVGAAAVAGGLLWIVLGRPSSSGSAPRVGLGPGSLSLRVPLD
ncbi:MAG TPA: hypothetical protein VGI39_22560 [Polyangiaceae bacterium]|jgi:hypothetical protein